MQTTTEPKTAKTQPSTRCNAKKVIVGNYFSLYGFGTVEEIIGGKFKVRNDTGFSYTVDKAVLENEYLFADQSLEMEKVNNTTLIEILRNNPRTSMTVTFKKKADGQEVADALMDGRGVLKQRTWRAKVNKLMAGRIRVMIGHHFNSFTEQGYLRFVENGKGLRVIDPRSVLEITVNQVTYKIRK